MAQTNLVGVVLVHVRLARYALPVLISADHGGGVQTVTRTGTPRPAAAQTVRDSPADGVEWGAAILGAPPRGLAVFDAEICRPGRCRMAAPFTEAGDKTWRVVQALLPGRSRHHQKVFRYTVEIENDLITMYGE